MNLVISRKISIWIDEYFDVDDYNKETIEAALDYKDDMFPYDIDTIYETQEELGPYIVYNEDREILEESD